MSPLGIKPVTFCLCSGSKSNESPQLQDNPGTTTETQKHEDTMRYYPAKKKPRQTFIRAISLANAT